MTEAGAPPGGLFGAFVPFDERSAETFFGRTEETALLDQLLAGEARVVTFMGASGVGKTSLLRAGLTPALARRGVAAVTIGSYRDLDRELVRETSRLGITPPVPGQDPADYLGGVAREAKGGLVLILDHLEEALGPRADEGSDVIALCSQVVDEGGPLLRLVLSIDEAAFARLETMRMALRSKIGARASTTLPRLPEARVADILERSAVQSGTPFENGLAAVVAADLCRAGPCRAIDLQITARAIADLRLGSLRRYRRSGGAAVVPAAWFDRVAAESGGAPARRALIAAATEASVSADDLAARARNGRDLGAEALAALRARGLLVAQARGRQEVFVLAHPALRDLILESTMADRARAAGARRVLMRRRAASERLRVGELYAISRNLRGALTDEERRAVFRSVGGVALRLGFAVVLVALAVAALFADSRRAYTLALDPPDAGGAARIVVRLGRRRLSLLNFLPNHPPLGSILADTGYTAASLSHDTVARIAVGGATGTLDAPPPGPSGRSHVPGWLREVLNGLRPVPRGIAKALLGDPDGVAALKQAFADPSARSEILSALSVIGRGGAGEDEILADALADHAPEIRRRGVEVAASIDRRQAGEKADGRQAGERADGRRQAPGAHAAILRTALADRSADVRAAVLQEAPTLPSAEAAGILTLALRDPDPTLRRRAEAETGALAERAPGTVVDALVDVLQSPDAGARRAALTLFETIAAKSPAESAAALARVVTNEKVADDVRVAALLILRRAGAPAPTLRPVLEKAIRPESSPRLRAAALPLYARLISPAEAEDLARTEMKGSPAARAASAAVWGAVAATRPDDALKPLKSMLYDPAMEIRIEAARAFGFLHRDGLDLTEKALKDPSPEVERAAIESALALSAQYPGQIADMLGRAVKTVRPAVRRGLVEALAHLGESRPAAALPPLAHAIKDSDVATRLAATNGFCTLAKKSAAAASPYLRIAARDDHDEVRTAAAACLSDVAAVDPKGAARMAAELTEAEQPAVRTAAAQALGGVRGNAAELAFPSLLKLVGDPNREVRAAAERAFTTLAPPLLAEEGGTSGAAASKRRVDAEHALEGALVQGDVAERQAIVAAAVRAELWGLLKQAARDGDETVRLEAVRAAGAGAPTSRGGGSAPSSPSSARVEIVRGAVDDRSESVRAEAMRLLAGAAGGGSRDLLPTFEAMLHGGDRAAREAAVAGVGALPDPGDAGFRLLGEAMESRSESLRTAAARAYGRLAGHAPERVAPVLERAVRDPSYDVRSAA
ncbi:MAG TPA: HEAT repeat domain-containing protein, partial [Polyangia bacterium]|nr:HEAT repeat domain-containing protein [Polyangia bacterium]